MEDVIKRKKDEPLIEYQIRLGRNKNLYGLSWDNIAALLNKEVDEEYSESKWRKEIQAYLRVYDYLIEKNVGIQELEEKKREFEIAKIQFQDQKREYRKLLRLESRVNHIKNEFVKALENVMQNKPLKWYKKERYLNNCNRSAVLLISDWHKGLFTSNYWNEFNDKIFYERVNELTNKTIEYGKHHDIKELNIFQIGDLVHGTLHRLTRVMDTEDVIRSTMAVSEVLAEMISIFANEFEIIKMYSARGNHDRVASNKQEEISSESFNDIIHWYLKTRLKEFENVKIVDNEYDDEIIVADILGHTVFGVHGHRDKLNNIVSDLTLMIKKIPKYIFSGHIHKTYENEVHGIVHVANSSLSGVDDYSKDIRKTSIPAQKLIIFNEKGRLCTYNIEFTK